jgi:hypothetical protein
VPSIATAGAAPAPTYSEALEGTIDAIAKQMKAMTSRKPRITNLNVSRTDLDTRQFLAAQQACPAKPSTCSSCWLAE